METAPQLVYIWWRVPSQYIGSVFGKSKLYILIKLWENNLTKIDLIGSSLVVYLWGFSAFTTLDWVKSLIWELRSYIKLLHVTAPQKVIIFLKKWVSLITSVWPIYAEPESCELRITDTVLSKCSWRNWCERWYKGRIHGTWWHLDDELDLGNEDNSSFLGDPENLDLEMLNVSLLLLGYTWESWPWSIIPYDIWPLTPLLASLTTTIPVIYWATKCSDFSLLETQETTSHLKAFTCINIVCLMLSSVISHCFSLYAVFYGKFFPAPIYRLG